MKLPFGRYRVEGESMTPALSPGERVFVRHWVREPEPGDLVVVRDPRWPGRLLLKRIVRRATEGWIVQGDNAGASTDSRHFGAVSRELIVGKVWFRY